LTQSPQQYKQLLMVGGVDRYFQIARCYRDESGRADRQPEFTQIDIEMAFVDREAVMRTAEGVVRAAWAGARSLAIMQPSAGTVAAAHAPYLAHYAAGQGQAAPPFVLWSPLPGTLERITYAHALCVYGSDKPDRRLGMPIANLTRVFAADSAGAMQWPPLAAALDPARLTSATLGSPMFPASTFADLGQLIPGQASVRGFRVPGLSASLSRKDEDILTQELRSALGIPAPAKSPDGTDPFSLMLLRVGPNLALKGSPLVTHLTADCKRQINDALGAQEGDLLVLGYSAANPSALCNALGSVRLLMAEALRVKRLPVVPFGTQVALRETDSILFARNLREKLPGSTFSSAQSKEKNALVSESSVENGTTSRDVDIFWVTDFPLFERAEDDDNVREQQPGTVNSELAPLQSTHHPFTSAIPAHKDELASVIQSIYSLQTGSDSVPSSVSMSADIMFRLLRIRGEHYDIVCNGSELGGGSIRIHEASLQRSVLADVLRVSPQQLHGFSHLMAALASGAPPHGGIALGLDRLVLTLAGPEAATSLRDVIAFPKTAAGAELMTGSPASVTLDQMKEYHIAPLA
jgi:aspartyl-tRNA synthetase